MNAVDQKFVVQVRSGGTASRSYIPNYLALSYPSPFLDTSGVVIQVCIFGFKAAAMLQDYQFAERPAARRPRDRAIACCANWCAAWRCIISTSMCANSVQYWVLAGEIEIGAEA